jgi:hypothetical protein
MWVEMGFRKVENTAPLRRPCLPIYEVAENALKEDAGLVADSGVELSRVLPVGYRKFLLKWFTRAITLVAYQVQKRDDKVADELMRFMLSKRGHDGLGASWWAQPTKKA